MMKSVKLKGNLSANQYMLMGIFGGVRGSGAVSVGGESEVAICAARFERGSGA